MATSVTLPALGESVTEGTVTRWLKQVGDRVEADEPLLEVSTDKVDTEIPSPVSGVLLEIKAAEDETIEVGAALAVIGDADEAASSDPGSSGGGSARPGAGGDVRVPGARGQQFRARRRGRHRGDLAGARRERDRRHREPLAEAGR